jgi:hypothetical protein
MTCGEEVETEPWDVGTETLASPTRDVEVEVVRSLQGEKKMEGITHVGSPVLNGVKAVGEAFVVPGASLILDGNVKGGALHFAGAYVARALLGPIGWALVAADSFSVSVSGKNLYEHFTKS